MQGQFRPQTPMLQQYFRLKAEYPDVLLAMQVGDFVAVILRGDVHAPRQQVLHRMVAPAMPELELVGARPQRQTHQLIAQADARDGNLAQQLAHSRNHGLQACRVARTWRE